MEAPMSPERQAALRGQVAIEPLSPERAEPGFAAMSIEGVTPERPTASPPADPARGRAPPDPTDSIVWFPAGDVRAIDIRDAVEHPAQFELTADGNRKKKKRTPLNQIGARVRVNELEVTLFRVGGILFAAQEACKHMGGPLSLGDIEDVDGFACLVCPNHGWAYEILEDGALSGRCRTRPDVVQPLYPVREGPDGKLLVGFEKIAKTIFEDDDF